MDSVILFLTYLFAVSIAAERFTEISKSLSFGIDENSVLQGGDEVVLK